MILFQTRSLSIKHGLKSDKVNNHDVEFSIEDRILHNVMTINILTIKYF